MNEAKHDPDFKRMKKEFVASEIVTKPSNEVYRTNYDQIDWGARARLSEENTGFSHSLPVE